MQASATNHWERRWNLKSWDDSLEHASFNASHRCYKSGDGCFIRRSFAITLGDDKSSLNCPAPSLYHDSVPRPSHILLQSSGLACRAWLTPRNHNLWGYFLIQRDTSLLAHVWTIRDWRYELLYEHRVLDGYHIFDDLKLYSLDNNLLHQQMLIQDKALQKVGNDCPRVGLIQKAYAKTVYRNLHRYHICSISKFLRHDLIGEPRWPIWVFWNVRECDLLPRYHHLSLFWVLSAILHFLNSLQ